MSDRRTAAPADPLVFDDLAPAERPVRIAGKDYVLREASAETARRYRACSIRGASADKDSGRYTLGDGIGDLEIILVAGCLFERAGPDGTTLRQVPEATVRGWPARVVTPLADAVLDLSPTLRGEVEGGGPDQGDGGGAADPKAPSPGGTPTSG